MPKGVYVRAPHEFEHLRKQNDRRRVGCDLYERAAAVAAANLRLLLATWEGRQPLQHASGVVSSAIAYRCSDCKRVIRGPAFFKHQRAQQHNGMTILEGEPE